MDIVKMLEKQTALFGEIKFPKSIFNNKER